MPRPSPVPAALRLLPLLLALLGAGAPLRAEPPGPADAARTARQAAALASPDASRRRAALAALPALLEQDALVEARVLPPLRELVRTRGEDERVLAVQALARARSAEGQRLWLQLALDDAQPEPVLRAAIDALVPRATPDGLLTALLEAASDRALRPTQRALALEAVGQAGGPAADLRLGLARPGADWVEEAGRALGLARRGGPRAIGRLVELLGSEDACPRVHAWEGLKRLTGQSLPPEQEPWASWWRAEREKAGTAGPAAPGEDPDGRYAQADGTHQPRYYGIPIPRRAGGTRVVFCCDVSQSMYGLPLERSRRELLATLKELTSEDRFEVVAFHEAPLPWAGRLVRAHPVQKVRALDWFLALEPTSYTNVYDSLEIAFGYGGRGRRAQAPAERLDAVFLLTDGEPNRGRWTGTREIVREVRTLAQPGIPLHAVGASEAAHPLLRALAAATGGTFTDGIE